MRMYGFDRYGDSDVEGYFDVPSPAPQPGQVLVRMSAAGVNPADIKVRSGRRQGRVEVRFPMAVGREAAGIVVEDPTHRFRPDELVFGSTASGTGAVAELVLLDAAQTTPVPHDVPATAAACIPVAMGTAWDCVHELRVGPGDVVLVIGAAGGVGIHAAQLARHRGATVLGLARPSKADLLAAYDVPHVPTDEDWSQVVRDLSSGRVDAVIDTVGGESLTEAAQLVHDPGRVRSVADPALASRLGGAGVTRRRDAAVYEQLARLVAEGALRPVIDRVHDFDDASTATHRVASGHASGKSVIAGPARHIAL